MPNTATHGSRWCPAAAQGGQSKCLSLRIRSRQGISFIIFEDKLEARCGSKTRGWSFELHVAKGGQSRPRTTEPALRAAGNAALPLLPRAARVIPRLSGLPAPRVGLARLGFRRAPTPRAPLSRPGPDSAGPGQDRNIRVLEQKSGWNREPGLDKIQFHQCHLPTAEQHTDARRVRTGSWLQFDTPGHI